MSTSDLSADVLGDLARSSRRSLSPRPCRKTPSLFEGTTVPPCWWDEEYPKQQQQLRRSMSDRRPRISPTNLSTRARQRTKEFKSSLWSAENREYLEMRFGLIQQSSNKEAPKHGALDDSMKISSPMKKDQEHELEAEWENLKKGHSASASSDEASSIFSNPDCSSFSSGSDVSSSIAAKEESSPPPAAERPDASSSSHEQNCAGFLEFDLVEGHLVDESARGEECKDFVTARASEDDLPPAAAAQDGGISPKKKPLGAGLRRPLPHSSFVHDDRYPVWASSSKWHLLRSYKERIIVGDGGGKRCSERKQVARRLLRGCSPVSSHMFHMIPGSLFSPRIGPFVRGCSSPPLRELFVPSPEPSEFRPKIGDVFGKNSSESGSDTELHQQQQRIKHSASRAAALNSKLVTITRKRQQQQLVATEEPEISCRPFLPVAAVKKSCLAGRRPLFSLRKKKCSSEAKESSSSSSSKDISVRHAHLHCVARHDHHSYTFVVDGSEELLVARTGGKGAASCSFYSWKQKRKPKSRSWKSAWSSSHREHKPESELVGSMRLSKKFKSGSVDLEFVLLKGGCSSDQEQVLPEMGSPSRLSFSSWDTSWLAAREKRNSWWYGGQSPSSSPGRARPAWMKKSLSQNCSPSRGKIDDDNMDVLRDLWMQMEAAELKKREETTDDSCSQSEEELAALVISVPAARNWIGFGSSDDHQYHETHDEHKINSMNNVTVILPVGHHGLPSDGSGGPRPLIERWRSDGKCDCGSWDLGCALNILQQQKQQSNLLEVSLQGSSKQQEEVLNLVALRNGLFSISFKEPLSPLQAFAAAVAILRSRRQEDFMGMHSRAPLQALDGYAARGMTPWSTALGIPPFERL